MALQAVIPLFPRFTALDAIGPYEVLQRTPDIDITFIGHERGEVRSENGFLGITRDATFEDHPEPDLIVFPGGIGTRPLVHDDRVLECTLDGVPDRRLVASALLGRGRDGGAGGRGQ